MIEISSRALREAWEAGRSIRFQVPEAVYRLMLSFGDAGKDAEQ